MTDNILEVRHLSIHFFTRAGADENLMPHIVRAVEAYATLGEISDRLRAVFGEYTGAGSE